jgi:5-methylcytosine-specific restriction endonuclease McrA
MALSKDARHHSTAWRALRLHILARDLWSCRMCGTLLRGKSKQAPEVDHIRPAELRPDLFYDADNLWSLCKSCHTGKCQAIEARHGSDDDLIAEAKAREAGVW